MHEKEPSELTAADNLASAIQPALAARTDDAVAEAFDGVRAVHEAELEATADPGELDPVAQIVGAGRAALTGDESPAELAQQAAALADQLRAAYEPARPITAWRKAATPTPVLWERGSMRPAGALHSEESECSAYCSVGEPALLSAPGGAGKSYLALAVASAAVTGEPPAGEGAELALEPAGACGLGVRPGPVVVCSFEDRPIRTWYRLRSILKRDGGRAADFAPPAPLHVCDDPQPLYASDGKPGAVAAPTPYWRRLWAHVARLRASLLIIDPASAAVAGISTNDSAPVREFMGLLSAASEATDCGVLIIAHDTKAARNEAAGGGNPGAGAVAGSATWYDAARGVLYLHHHGQRRLLRCLKANHGRAGGGFMLAEVFADPDKRRGFQGFAGAGPGVLNSAECDGELRSWKEAAREAVNAAKKKRAAANTEGGPDDEDTIA